MKEHIEAKFQGNEKDALNMLRPENIPFEIRLAFFDSRFHSIYPKGTLAAFKAAKNYL
ncbi:MAG: hypothetical protein ACQEW2_18830 [Bacillota bacterium]|uniref:hypothetical protein n=1 Tax=Cytobacillus firmus TaxID=1399 RepID=UPI0015586013|nr:hypothetical protein [Cytobacillus firmus]MEC1894530.1 hypothetical protein [Cytobacillus firmus]MED1941889.1 hypothetical protein [Cytobacillus firmus]MED4451122.1 hypothetical protein [Cytobacillus firmus]MED4770627.1 hypothetical protein [Cytobacillus firmus]